MGHTATEQCHFPASKQEGSIVHSSQRECSAISLNYLAPKHFANKSQPGPNLPQCRLCYAALLDHLCADISKSKLQALLPPQLTHISSGTCKARIRPIFPFFALHFGVCRDSLVQSIFYFCSTLLFFQRLGLFSSFKPIQPSYSELLFSLFILPHLSPDLLRY